jgi:hypothetical protein
MSRATTEAWYNSDRSERLRLVAAYFVLNAVVGLGLAVYRTIQLAGNSGSTFGGGGIIISVLLPLVFALAWLQAARLLWNHRKTGAYWAIVLTLFGVLQWLAAPSQGLIDLLFVLIPLALIAMSWGSLTSGPVPDSR